MHATFKLICRFMFLKQWPKSFLRRTTCHGSGFWHGSRKPYLSISWHLRPTLNSRCSTRSRSYLPQGRLSKRRSLWWECLRLSRQSLGLSTCLSSLSSLSSKTFQRPHLPWDRDLWRLDMTMTQTPWTRTRPVHQRSFQQGSSSQTRSANLRWMMKSRLRWSMLITNQPPPHTALTLSLGEPCPRSWRYRAKPGQPRSLRRRVGSQGRRRWFIQRNGPMTSHGQAGAMMMRSRMTPTSLGVTTTTRKRATIAKTIAKTITKTIAQVRNATTTGTRTMTMMVEHHVWHEVTQEFFHVQCTAGAYCCKKTGKSSSSLTKLKYSPWCIYHDQYV